MTGQFIVFEGIDGSGKTSVIHDVAMQLRAKGKTVAVHKEPGTTHMGKEIRKLLKSDIDRAPLAEVLLFQASRADTVTNVLLPALETHDYVLMDRYTTSTLVYQGYGYGIDIEQLNTLNTISTGGLTPDIEILIHVNNETASQRRGIRNEGPDRYDDDNELLQKVKIGYDVISKELDMHVVDNNGELQQAVDAVLKLIDNRRTKP